MIKNYRFFFFLCKLGGWNQDAKSISEKIVVVFAAAVLALGIRKEWLLLQSIKSIKSWESLVCDLFLKIAIKEFGGHSLREIALLLYKKKLAGFFKLTNWKWAVDFLSIFVANIVPEFFGYTAKKARRYHFIIIVRALNLFS